MPTPEGNKFRTMAEKALKMKSPCLQITPVFPNKLDEWAKLLYFFIKMAKQIQDKIGLPFVVDIVETGGATPQCQESYNGLHELMRTAIRSDLEVLACIHCGFITTKTNKDDNQIKEHYRKKLFIEPKPFDDGSNH